MQGTGVRASTGQRQGHRREIEREFGNGIHNHDPYDDLSHQIFGAEIQRDLGADTGACAVRIQERQTGHKRLA